MPASSPRPSKSGPSHRNKDFGNIDLRRICRHYLGYEQETSRNIYRISNASSTDPYEFQLPISSNIDDRTTHEVYMWGFAEAVRAGVGSVMCAYNR